MGERRAGWFAARRRPISQSVLRYFARFSPFRAIRDLRRYLQSRQPYELWFMMAALAVTGIIMFTFLYEQVEPPVYRPNIIYVQQWRADRTDAEIRAQQKIDQAVRDKEEAAQKKREEELRQQFKRVNDQLERYGI